MVRAGNGFTWALLFNTRPLQDSAFYAEMDQLGWQALAAVSTWPTNDLFDSVLSLDKSKSTHSTRTNFAMSASAEVAPPRARPN
jgi:hypothetical protein